MNITTKPERGSLSVKQGDTFSVRHNFDKGKNKTSHMFALLDKYIDKIMNEVMNKHKEEQTNKAIKEYFQNHATKFELKI